jgi:hypothetical protein
VLSVASAQPVSERRELFPPLPRPPSKSTLSSRVSTSTHPSPVLVSRSFARIFSAQPPPQSTVSLLMPRSTNPRFTRSSSSEVLPVFQESRSSSPTTSTERSQTSPSILTKLSHTELPSRLLFSLEIPPPSPPTRFSSSMSRLCPSVSRLLVVK